MLSLIILLLLISSPSCKAWELVTLSSYAWVYPHPLCKLRPWFRAWPSLQPRGLGFAEPARRQMPEMPRPAWPQTHCRGCTDTSWNKPGRRTCASGQGTRGARPQGPEGAAGQLARGPGERRNEGNVLAQTVGAVGAPHAVPRRGGRGRSAASPQPRPPGLSPRRRDPARRCGPGRRRCCCRDSWP